VDLFLPGLGESAALATAFAWSLCARAFAGAGLRIGSVAVNHLRLVAGVLLLTLMHAVLIGGWPAAGMSREALFLFVLSGVVGLTLGDAALFRAWVLIGPARGTLVMTTAPAWAAFMAAAFLGERLPPIGWTGIAVTLAGVVLAVTGRETGRSAGGVAATQRQVWLGLGLAGLGALGQAGGVVLAKPALADVPALSGTWVRMLAAMLALWLVTGVRCSLRGSRPAWWDRALADRRGLLLTLAGTIAGPSIGVWLSLVATKHAEVGVAATLMSITPVFVMLSDWLAEGRRPRPRERAGTAVAIAGVALLVGSRA
jgi:drug/metabolite transporter (DMT)-like permease